MSTTHSLSLRQFQKSRGTAAGDPSDYHMIKLVLVRLRRHGRSILQFATNCLFFNANITATKHLRFRAWSVFTTLVHSGNYEKFATLTIIVSYHTELLIMTVINDWPVRWLRALLFTGDVDRLGLQPVSSAEDENPEGASLGGRDLLTLYQQQDTS